MKNSKITSLDRDLKDTNNEELKTNRSFSSNSECSQEALAEGLQSYSQLRKEVGKSPQKNVEEEEKNSQSPPNINTNVSNKFVLKMRQKALLLKKRKPSSKKMVHIVENPDQKNKNSTNNIRQQAQLTINLFDKEKRKQPKKKHSKKVSFMIRPTSEKMCIA